MLEGKTDKKMSKVILDGNESVRIIKDGNVSDSE